MEVCYLRAEDIDWKRGRVKVRGKGSKERWVSPGPTALRDIRAYLGEQRTGVVFGLRSGHNLYQIVCRMGQRAGVVNPYVHRFRITFAVRFLREYGDLAALRRILGHEHLSTTEHYAAFGIGEDALAMQARLDLAAG
jgi:site-specific recombinase XerD